MSKFAPPSPQEPDFSDLFPMPVEDARNFFQIGNKDIYETPETDTQFDFIRKWQAMLSFMNSKFSGHLIDEMDFTESAFKMRVSDDYQSCIATVEYYEANPDTQEHEQRLAVICFAIVEFINDDGAKTLGVKPYFSLNGIVSDDGGFTPEEAIIRTDYGEGEELIGADKPEEFMMAMCYGETAFESIIVNESIHIGDSQVWLKLLNNGNIGVILDRFTHVAMRQPRFLTEVLAENLDNAGYAIMDTGMGHPPCPTPQ